MTNFLLFSTLVTTQEKCKYGIFLRTGWKQSIIICTNSSHSFHDCFSMMIFHLVGYRYKIASREKKSRMDVCLSQCTRLNQHTVRLDKYTKMNEKYAKKSFWRQKRMKNSNVFVWSNECHIRMENDKKIGGKLFIKYMNILSEKVVMVKDKVDVLTNKWQYVDDVIEHLFFTIKCVDYCVHVNIIYISCLCNQEWFFVQGNINRDKSSMLILLEYFIE